MPGFPPSQHYRESGTGGTGRIEWSLEEADNKGFWSRYAKLYDFEVDRFSHRAYERMYQLMSESLGSDMDVLEVATGTGLIALNIAGSVRSVAATDFSSGMIAKASRKPAPANVTFSIEDATSLSFADASFDAVIISNALHIMQNPRLVLKNIRRVLRPGGLLIAPTFSHGHLRQSTWNLNTRLLRHIGFETYSKWTPEEYVAFISDNGFRVSRWLMLNAAFPLVYLEAHVSLPSMMSASFSMPASSPWPTDRAERTPETLVSDTRPRARPALWFFL